MGRDTVQLETAVNTISHEYLLDFTSEYSIPKTLHPELPGPGDRIVDFPEGKTNAPKDGMPAEDTYFVEAVRELDTHRTPIQKQPEMLLCVVGISHGYYLEDEVYKTNCCHMITDMDLFNLIRAPNPTKVKVRSRPRAPHEVPLLTLTANRVIEMDDPVVATDSSGVPSTIERSPLDFALEAGASDQGTVAPEMPTSKDMPATIAPGTSQAEEFAAVDPAAAAKSRKRGRDGIDVNAPPKSLRRDHANPRPSGSSHGGKSLAAIQLGLASTAFVPKDTPTGVNDPDPLSFADPLARHSVDSSHGIAVAGDPKSENASFAAEVGSPESVYRPEWGVTKGSLLDTPEACQDLVDHVAPLDYFFELRHMHNEEFLRQYNVNLARQVARRDKRIQARELEIRNLEASLEAEVNGKRAAEDKSAGLSQELENMRAQFSDLQVSNERLSQQVANLQQQVSGEEKLKAAFEEYKRQQDERVEQRCRGLRLAVTKCGESLELRQAFADAVSAGIVKGLSEGLRHRLEHGQAQRSLESIEAYDTEVEAKFVTALQALKDLKYPLVDQLEGLRDASMDVIMAALYLESDTGDDASQDIRDLRPSYSQLTIPVYPEVRDPRNPWACKEEIVLADVITANISRA
uniref:Transposase (Putative), gypsy type n=1 Tax=Tanacetum cinerariifolium TaxID=118510 RepID=A0A6L2LQQ4_TANCI|nr:hypothetical protein [Tanacetum cinerariifolium]